MRWPIPHGKTLFDGKRNMALVRKLFSTVPHSTVITCFQIVKSLVTRAKSCYADEINIEEMEFVKMLLVDGCFLVGLLMKYWKRNSEEPTYWVGFEEHGEEPLRGSSNNSRFIWGQIFHDLMKIENQIPFFVVEKLYNLLVPPDDDHISIIELAHSYLKEHLEFIACSGKNFNLENQKVQHLFDLLYQIHVTGDWTLNHKETPSDKRWSCKWIQCAMKLRDCGIRFHQKKGTSILDVKFQKGVMEIPSTSMFDGVVSILKNLIAYEQCYSPVQYFTTYASFMDFLIDTPKDGKVLCDANIIKLSFSNKDEVSTVFNNL